MRMDLGLRLYLAVNEPESRDRKVKVLTVPVGLTERELLTEGSLVDLDDVDAVSWC